MSHEQDLEQQLREISLTTDRSLDERIVDDAIACMSRKQASSQSPSLQAIDTPLDRRLLGRVIPSVTILGGLLLVLVWWVPRPTDTWAQVVEAVQQRPWVHLTGEQPGDGVFDQWYGMHDQISAYQSSGYSRFSNLKQCVTESYSVDNQKIIRNEQGERSSDQVSYDSFTLFFEELFQGKKDLSIAMAFTSDPDVPKVDQSRREINDATGHWYEYSLVIRQQGPKPHTMKVRVDADTLLPQTMTVVDGDHDASMTVRFDFPETGPQDIYALGVPRDTEIVDHSPHELAGDRKQLADAIRQAAEGFDDYRALAILSDPDLPWHVGTPMLVWRRGNQSRTEIGSIDPDAPLPTDIPGDDADQVGWWKERCNSLWFMPVQVFDGDKTFSAQFVSPESEHRHLEHPHVRRRQDWAVTGWREESFRSEWPARTAPIVWTYSQNIEGRLESPLYKIEVIDEPTDSAPQAIRIKAVSAPDGLNRADEWNYLLDPDKGYALLHSTTASYTIEAGEKTLNSSDEQTFDDWKQSPRGYWYPTLYTSKSSYMQNGEQVRNTARVRYDLDFDVEMPDTLFEPRERTIGAFPD
ncbi:MAG: hypothetical protein KDA93_14195 [Planctomycetaceae bacterium]|nr:hypothetical protein [Planctomycetaceae bacterium]